MDDQDKIEHNELQRNYYENALNKPAMQVVHSTYVLRHVKRVINAVGLCPGQRILEVGAGLGKFSIPLAHNGLLLTCLDISPVMLERLADTALKQGVAIETVACDIADAPTHLSPVFDGAVGFFTLHHMHDLALVFRGLQSVLLPGAKVAFCEPVAYNALYYLQVAMMSGMRWQAEKGIVNMRRSVVEAAMKAAGLMPISHHSYGFFPPVVTNRRWGACLEDRLGQLALLKPLHAFQIFCAENPR